MPAIDRDIAEAIIKRDYKRELRTLSRFACRSASAVRQDPEKIPDRSNVRQAFSQDADRIIHSLAYTRYIDKTQVFYLVENDHITHRVLHVQIVSKIARCIARLLALNEDLVEAISLGHDVGHSPYGHNGEKLLQEFSRQQGIGDFVHNAQSYRLLSQIENRRRGLNLSIQVLDGILSHNGEILSCEYRPVPPKTWDELQAEFDACMRHADASLRVAPMTLEGCVVRISDIIAYLGRDFEDAIKLRLIQRTDLPMQISEVLGNKNSAIINTLVTDLLNNSYDKDHLAFSEEIFEAMKTMLNFNCERIYENPRKRTQDEKIANVFRTVLNRYLSDLHTGKKESKINRWVWGAFKRDYLGQTPAARIAVDYVSGMTDDFLNSEFEDMILPKSFGLTFK